MRSLVFVLFAACAAAPAKLPVVPPSLRAIEIPLEDGAKLPTREDWTGAWAAVSPLGDAPAGTLRVAKKCASTIEHWALEQKGEALRLRRVAPTGAQEEDYASGTVKNGVASALGDWVRIRGGSSETTPVEYVLQFEPKKGHLLVTRNGRKLELAPVVFGVEPCT